jgi:CRP/FNR family transcriptional activator FtrB
MRDDDAEELRRLPLFAGVAGASFSSLVRAGYLQTFPAGVQLISQGDPADFLHIVVEGAVELSAEWEGDQATMAILRPMSTFVLAATITDRPYLLSARTLGKTRIVLLPSEDVRDAFARDPGFAAAVLAELADCYRSAVRHTKELKLRSGLERLANHLLRQMWRHGGAPVFELDVEKRTLAAYLGMKPENLSRAFAGLRRYGVEVDGSMVRLADVPALEKLAKPTRLIDDPV